MSSVPGPIKVTSKPTFRRSVIDSLDLYHRALADVLAERGEIRIITEAADG